MPKMEDSRGDEARWQVRDRRARYSPARSWSCAHPPWPPRTAPRKLLFGSKRIQGWNPRGLRFTELTSIRTDDPEISPHQSERSL